ncbi:MAG: LacI family DNA-binding transcriptional regulator [Chloroflexi bacterium]|nr:LacI family DNA-binding transcriptional regulator [Chloroflexota bacterium]
MTDGRERGERAWRRTNMREVAELAEVAISSVSRVLSGHPDVSQEMRDRVLDAVAQLEYEPDFLAQSLRRGQTLSVGFVLADVSNPLMAEIVLGAESELRGAGYSLLLMNSESDPALDAAHVRFYQGRRVDGMILSLVSETDPRTLEVLRAARVPLVVVDRELASDIRASSVVNDHAAGMSDAVRHLIGLGHRRIALITGALDTLPGRERMESMKRVIAEADGAVEGRYLPGSFSAEHGQAAAAELFAGTWKPSAIVCGGNQLLIGCLRVIQERDLEVGRDISLVTCDDVALSGLYRPPIASISRDTVAIGRTAAELLLRRLAGSSEPERVVLPTTYTPRASVAPPSAR